MSRLPPSPRRTALSKTAYGLCVILSIGMFLVLYWLKSFAGVSIFEHYSLSNYFPFCYLVPDRVIEVSSPQVILDDGFEHLSFFGNWGALWMEERGKVRKRLDNQGYHGSKCLLVVSRSPKSWSCSFRKLVQVIPGERFGFRLLAKLSGNDLVAQAAVATFDRNRSVILWNYASQRTRIKGDWAEITGSFTVPEQVAYIRFRLSGSGVGDFRFDDVRFAKLSAEKP